MRIKALLAALLVAGLTVSAAIAGPPPGRGKGKRDRDRGAVTQTSTSDSTSTEEPSDERGKRDKRGERGKGRASAASCRPTVSFILKGEFVSASVSATGEGSFAMLVKRANKHGRQYVGKQVTVETGRFTKMKRRGPSSLDKLEAGDRLVVQVRACKAGSQESSESSEGSEGSEGSTAPAAAKLYAKRVVAHPKKSDDGDGDDESTSTSTSTSTATTTTDSTSTSTSTSTETTTTSP